MNDKDLLVTEFQLIEKME